MDKMISRALGFGITCIDAGYVSEGVASFYMMEEGDEVAVLETGTSHSVKTLLQVLKQSGVEPGSVRYVIPTHVHLDHAGGAGAMMAVLPNAQLLIHPRGARHMADPSRLIGAALEVYGRELYDTLYGEVIPVDVARIREMDDGETVLLAGRKLEFRHTRGHAEHHFCVWDEVSRGWFSGDMFGVSYPWCQFSEVDFVLPSTTPSQFDPVTYLESLQILKRYSPQRMYLTHYGELAYSAEKSELLTRQIKAYCEFAVVDSVNAIDLQKRLTDYTLELFYQIGANGDEAQIRNHLVFDMQLNAQGLQMWQQRIANK